MTTLALYPSTAPADLTRAWWVATGLALASVMAWDASSLDLTVMAWLGTAHGFPMRHNWWLETVLHDTARRAATVLYIGLWAMLWRPVGFFKHFQRHERLEMALGVTVALIAVTLIKRYSLTSCPWELQTFGGAASYVSHWQWGLTDGGGGMCFPGGHASSALAFLALALPGLAALPGSKPYQTAKRLLAVVLLAGAALGAVQTLRGAHYPSHTLWTGWVCWVAASAMRAGLGQWRGWRAGARRLVAAPVVNSDLR